MGIKADFLIVNTQNGDIQDQVVVSIPRDQTDKYLKVQVYPKDKQLHGEQPLFFTQVDKQNGKMSGYRINRKTLACTQMWTNTLSNKATDGGLVIERVFSQANTDSTASLEQHILPTTSGEDGALLYKFFDTNMFAVSASKASNPSDMSFFVINSISGRIVYQILEKNVNRDTQAEVNAILSENKFILSF